MLIIFGRRVFGRVDMHGGEYAQTMFAHVWYMPLFPIKSYWITQDGGAPRGFEIRLHGRSVLFAYLRMWAPIAAIACFVAGSVGALVAGAVLSALSLAAWAARTARPSRRSDFNLVAFGSRCEPARMPAEMRARVKQGLQERWDQLGLTRPPEDIAQYGAKSIAEAATAFGLLRIAGVERRDPSAHAAADRITSGQYDVTPAADGPYREDHADHADHAHPGVGAVLAQVEAIASAHSAERVAAPSAPWWQLTRGKGFLVAILAMAGLGGIMEEGPALRGATYMDAADLQQLATPNPKQFVRVECDSLELLGTFSDDTAGYGCHAGTQVLPIVAKPGREGARALVGTLVAMDSPLADEVWPNDLRRTADTLPIYLTEASIRGHQTAAVLCIVGEVVLAGIVGFWLVERRRRKA
ncbi:MAG: hypothetical protein ABI467_19725 [Kofleriaceae bacterium]